MNIQVKKKPSITIEDGQLYAERKTALYYAECFIDQVGEYRKQTKVAINDIAYGSRSLHYHVRLTKTGNIKVKVLRGE